MSQTGIAKPISIAVLNSINLKENFKTDLDRNLLLKNLSKNLTGRQFYLMMREFGDLKLCKLVVDFYGASKGYGYAYYYDAKSAEEAIKNLNGKEIDGKSLVVCNLIPGKTKENYRNNIYVKNFPKEFTESDLKNLFQKYGEIKSAIVSKDADGVSKGFGFVCFVNPGHANQACREIREQNIIFPGLDPLYLNYAQKKDERLEMLMKDSSKLEQLCVFARLRDDMYLIKTQESFEKEIKDFVNLLLVQEYHPREVKIKMETKTALITMNSQKDVEFLMTKYVEYCNFTLPRIVLNYYQNKNDRTLTNNYINQINSMINPINMFSNFQNLSIVDPNTKPIIQVDPNQPFPLKQKLNEGNGYTNNYNNKNGYRNKKNYYNKNNYQNNNYKRNNNYKYNHHNQNYNQNYNYNDQQYYNNGYNGNNSYQNNNQEISLTEMDKISVATPVYELETKDEVASTIFEIVVKKYPE